MNADSTVSNVSSPNLGIVYSAQFLKDALETKPKDSSKNYVLVGLLIKKIVEKEFKIEALFFNNDLVDTFNSKEIQQSDLIEYVSNIEKKADSNGSGVRTDQNSLKKFSKIEFWGDETDKVLQNEVSGPFVFFSKNSIELLIAGDVQRVSFSGAKIDYGKGIREFEKPGFVGVTSYPTLKAESNLGNSNDNEYIPNVILGLPCPPYWSDDGDGPSDLQTSLPNNSVLYEIKRNFQKYGDTPRSPISGIDLGQMNFKWNHFIKSTT